MSLSLGPPSKFTQLTFLEVFTSVDLRKESFLISGVPTRLVDTFQTLFFVYNW